MYSALDGGLDLKTGTKQIIDDAIFESINGTILIKQHLKQNNVKLQETQSEPEVYTTSLKPFNDELIPKCVKLLNRL